MVKEILQNNKDRAFSLEDLEEEIIDNNKRYAKNWSGTFEKGIDAVNTIAKTISIQNCLDKLLEQGITCKKTIRGINYYNWCKSQTVIRRRVTGQ